ncbi:hypothetical protein DDE82_008553 [Stemphylium lycopersici]|nr:hypothetical protein DDE82_008553 [Stemphylium lycopersici]
MPSAPKMGFYLAIPKVFEFPPTDAPVSTALETKKRPTVYVVIEASPALNNQYNLSTCHVLVSRIRTIINLFEAYKSKDSLTKRDWDILFALERIFTNGKGIKFMQLSVADVALSYDAFKRIRELGVKRNKDHWLFFEDSEGRNTMDLVTLKSIANSNCRMSNKNSDDLENDVRYFAKFRKTRMVDVYPKEVSKDRRRNILKYFDSGPHYMPNDNSGNEIEYFALDTSTGRQVRLHPDDITGVILPLFLALTMEKLATNTLGELSEPENSTQFKPMCLRSGRELPMPGLTGCVGQDHVVHVDKDEQPAIYDSVKPNRQDEPPVAAARSTDKGPAGGYVVLSQRNDDENSAQNNPSFYEIGSDSGSNDDDCYEANDRKGRSKNVDSSSNSVLYRITVDRLSSSSNTILLPGIGILCEAPHRHTIRQDALRSAITETKGIVI